NNCRRRWRASAGIAMVSAPIMPPHMPTQWALLTRPKVKAATNGAQSIMNDYSCSAHCFAHCPALAAAPLTGAEVLERPDEDGHLHQTGCDVPPYPDCHTGRC